MKKFFVVILILLFVFVLIRITTATIENKNRRNSACTFPIYEEVIITDVCL